MPPRSAGPPDPANSALLGHGDFSTESSGVRARMAERVDDDVAAAFDTAGVDADPDRLLDDARETGQNAEIEPL